MTRPRYRRVTSVAGGLVLLYGVRGLLQHRGATHPYETLRLLVGLDIVHDLLVVPIVLGLWILVRRVTPAAVAAVLTAGAFISAVVAVFAYPAIRGYGRVTTTPSRLPNNYATGLSTTLAVVWGVLAVVAAVSAWRRRRT